MQKPFEEVLKGRKPVIEWLARKISRSFGGNDIDVEEMVAAGNVALWQCFRKYDETRGVTFWDYAQSRVKGAMVDYQRSRDHVPRSGRDHIKNQTHVPWAMTLKVGDLSTVMNLQSLENPEKGILQADFESKIMELVRRLPDPLRMVLMERHRIPTKEIAARLKVSESRISQLYKEAVEVIRRRMFYCDTCRAPSLEEPCGLCPACGGALWPAEPCDFLQISKRRHRRTKTVSP